MRELEAGPAGAADTVDDHPAPAAAATRRTRFRSLVEWAVLAVAAVLAATAIQHWVIQVYEIPSESMVPTLLIGDRVAVNKLAYAIGGGVERGDVVVFHRPRSEVTAAPDQAPQLIKRVIGLPGDLVEARGGVVYINGKPLDETGKGYLSGDVVTNNIPTAVKVAPRTVFVMGDNRERSRDSRFFGSIPESSIIGRAVAIAWPPRRWGSL
ncbi:MAG: signal peptidase I [Microthrixaceae bacterium]